MLYLAYVCKQTYCIRAQHKYTWWKHVRPFDTLPLVNRTRLVGLPHNLWNLVFHESKTLCTDNIYGSQAALDNTPTEFQLQLQKMAPNKTPRPNSRLWVRLRPQTCTATTSRGLYPSCICSAADPGLQHRGIFKLILVTPSFPIQPSRS